MMLVAGTAAATIVGAGSAEAGIGYEVPSGFSATSGPSTITHPTDTSWRFTATGDAVVFCDEDVGDCFFKITYANPAFGGQQSLQFQETGVENYAYVSPHVYINGWGYAAIEYETATSDGYQSLDSGANPYAGTIWVRREGDELEARYGGATWAASTLLSFEVITGVSTADRISLFLGNGDDVTVEFLPLP